MTTGRQLARLRELRVAIDNAQARAKRFTEMRDELIAEMLNEHAATGDMIGAAAGVSQPRTVQIKNAVNLRHETERAATKTRRGRRLKAVAS